MRSDIQRVPGFSEAFLQENCKDVPLTLPSGTITRQWAFGKGKGNGVKVAILDTGVDGSHPGVGTVQGFADMLDSSEGISTAPHEDVFGHGTACAGIVRSLAPECEIYSVRVLGRSLFGTGKALLRGIEWAVENECTVCNLSLGTTEQEFFAALHKVADDAYFKSIAVVVAANNMPVPSFPAVFASVISVASHSYEDPEVLLYNAEPPVEFGARGINVLVPWLDRGYVRTTGNSYAAPHVTGFVARMQSEHPDLTPSEIKTVLKAISRNFTIGELLRTKNKFCCPKQNKAGLPRAKRT